MDVCSRWGEHQDPVAHFSQGTEQPLDINDFWQFLTWVRFKAMTPKGEVLLSPAAAPGSHPPLCFERQGRAARSSALAQGNPINMHRR